MSLEGREGIQADVRVYKGTKAGNCRCVRQLHLEQSGAAGPGGRKSIFSTWSLSVVLSPGFGHWRSSSQRSAQMLETKALGAFSLQWFWASLSLGLRTPGACYSVFIQPEMAFNCSDLQAETGSNLTGTLLGDRSHRGQGPTYSILQISRHCSCCSGKACAQVPLEC